MREAAMMLPEGVKTIDAAEGRRHRTARLLVKQSGKCRTNGRKIQKKT